MVVSNEHTLTNDSGYGTEQENFWAGEFGNEYISRNRGSSELTSKTALFARIVQHTASVRSAVELGANIGLNLTAIRILMPGISCTGVEINANAFKELARCPGVQAVHASLLDWTPVPHDLSFTMGVLIHLNPDALPIAYQQLYDASRRYVLICEYYSPTPIEVVYRGFAGRLFKRDFAGEFLDRFPDVQLIDYGFVYRRDPNFPQDDLTWFLFDKRDANPL